MKRLIVCLTVACCLVWSLGAQNPYFTAEEMPDMVYILPAPPEEGSARFADDIARYRWGKEQRKDQARADMAIRDAVYSVNTICSEYSEIFGLQLSKENTPKIYELLKNVTKTCDLLAGKAKKTYMRTRPYAYFNEGTLFPSAEERLRTNGSYPS